MVSKIKYLAFATAIALTTASGAMAAQQGGVKVGSLTQTTVASQANNLALGSDAKARQAIGSIRGDVQVGVIRQTTVVNSANNLALGSKAAACQTIGTIGEGC